MAAETLGDVLRRIGRLAGLQAVLSLTDAQLLERFAVGRDEPAFAALMVRHGPMVLGVCRRLLRDSDQAEDAFQASFLVLARKAGSIQRQPLLSAWLYGVAYKVAARLRGRTWKRQSRETSGVDLASVAATVEPDSSDLPPLLHKEVQRLPDKYRNPIILCYLEGKTHEEAALLLHWPLGTVKGRLSRARDLLRSRLTRRGVTASEGVMATALAAKPAAAPARLTDATLRAATRFAAGDGGAGKLASARAIALSQGVLRTMMLTKVKIAGVLLLTVTMLGGGAGWLAFRAPASEPSVPVAKAADDKPKDDNAAIQGTWVVAGVERDGKEVPDDAQTKEMKASKLIIMADKITSVTSKLHKQNASYQLDPTKKPKHLDLTPLDGPENLKGKTLPCLYSLDGDVLKICANMTASGERPTELATKEGGSTMLTTFKRVTADKDKPKEDKPQDEKAAAPPKAIQKIRTAVQRDQSSRNLQELVIALMNVDLANRRYPAAAVFDKDGKPLLSWRVMILPYIGQEALYKEFHLDEAWDSDNNKKLLEKMPPLFAAGDEQALKNHETYYQVFVGKGAAFEGTKGLDLIEDFPDGTSCTILLVEAKKAVPWTKPEDIPFDAGKLMPKLGGLDNAGFWAAFADGSRRFISVWGKDDVLRVYITRNSGEVKP